MRTYGAYYTDLPSNMLGSFIMGCLATSSALGLAVDKVQQGMTANQTLLCPVISSPGCPPSSLVRTQIQYRVYRMLQAVGILPAGHPWQGNAPLLAGLRTGYCGSLTTFSAWQLQCVLLLVGGRGRQGGQWDQVRPFSPPCSTRPA
jgi:fluoride exporter